MLEFILVTIICFHFFTGTIAVIKGLLNRKRDGLPVFTRDSLLFYIPIGILCGFVTYSIVFDPDNKQS